MEASNACIYCRCSVAQIPATVVKIAVLHPEASDLTPDTGRHPELESLDKMKKRIIGKDNNATRFGSYWIITAARS